MTLAEKTANVLKSMGYQEIESPSRKFRKFEHREHGRILWLGRKGAVRSGKTLTASWSVTDKVKKYVNSLGKTF